MTTLYGVRHKPTGHFVPPPRSGHRATHVEPAPNCTPRLWNQERHAKVFLTFYVQGKAFSEHTYNEWLGEHDVREGFFPGTQRNRDDFEIVPFTLHERDEDDEIRNELARIVEQIAEEGMPHPRHLDSALDAILSTVGLQA